MRSLSTTAAAAACSLLVSSSSAFVVVTSPATSSSSGVRTSLAAGRLLDLSERAERRVQEFEDWAVNCGVERLAAGLSVESSVNNNDMDQTDYSTYTADTLAQGTDVLVVPADMILRSTWILQDTPTLQAGLDQLNRLGSSSDEHAEFLLFAHLLSLYEQGDESPWFPWMDSLPRLFFNAVSMTDFCYECLPPLVYRYARAERVKFDNFVQALQKVNVVSPDTLANTQVTKWAFNVVQTRCQAGKSENEKLIIPMVDMFNHATDPEVAIDLEESGDAVAYTLRDVPAGSPLRVSYGDPTNPSKLFALYGFLDETSPATFCKITNIQPTDELRNIGYDFSRMLFYKDTGAISEEVWDVMLYQILASNQAERQSFYQAHMTGDTDTKNAIHEDYFAETSTALKEHVDTFLDQLDELSAKSVGKDLREHPRLPLILKHNEFVRSTFLAVKERLDPMVAQAVGQPEYA